MAGSFLYDFKISDAKRFQPDYSAIFTKVRLTPW